MNPELARKTIVETFREKFDDARFLYFIRNLVNDLDESKKQTWTLKKAAFEDFVNHFTRLGTYTDPDSEKMDVLVIHLRKETTLARGRVTLRNFVADYLATGHGQGKAAVIAAFVSPQEDDWRFSFVKLDYTFEKTELGLVAERIQLTPARRYSYLVGKNENCHTAQKQFLALLEADQVNPSVAQLEAAFSVEKVTKEFYEHYKDLFEQTRDALAAFLDSAPAIKTHFAERGIECDDFAKKLLGQIVFLYFLQKKGWFGVERGQPWGSGRRDFIRHLFNNRADYAHIPGQRKRPANFFNDILEPLFYEAIAAPRTDDDHYYSRFDCRIPFLNGGLFEPLYGYNWVETEILLPDTLFANDEQTKDDTGTGILDVFDRYNFTVNEAEPLEKEVAVDPEMLGLVFENLLPENVRHSSGTFYTPRVIVHYMCQQALLHYLTARAADIPQAELVLFLRLAERFTDFQAKETKKHADKLLPENIRNNAARLDALLAAITVCDPAIGSGAFPVGMMLEICRARMALAAMEGMPEQTFYHLKRHAIQHSLYGVDLDPGAVEIAKLRLWLSMVVDEDNITDIQPLPNLDYKIMQGNSLLEEFDGVHLLDDKLLQPPAASRESEIANLKTRRSAFQAEAIRLHGEGKKGAPQKLAAEQEIKQLNKQLSALVNPDEAGTDGQGELNQQTSWASLKRIQELHSKFFDENSRAEKDKLRRELDALEWNFMEATLREQGREAALAELKRASATHRKPFFLWRLQFGEVFQQRGGFDVVIMNPPYGADFNEYEKGVLKTKYDHIAERIRNSFLYFMGLGYNIAKADGVLSYILPNEFLFQIYMTKARRFFVNNSQVLYAINTGEDVFDAIVPTCVVAFQKRTVNSYPIPVADLRECTLELLESRLDTSTFAASSSDIVLATPNSIFAFDLGSTALINKLAKNFVPFGDFCEDVANGISTSCDEIYIVTAKFAESEGFEKNYLKQCIRGGQFNRYYCPPTTNEYILYITSEFDPKIGKNIHRYLSANKAMLVRKCVEKNEGSRQWNVLFRSRYEDLFKKPKMLIRQTADRIVAAPDTEVGYYCIDSVNVALLKEAFVPQLNFLVGLLNSSLLNFFYREISQEGGRVLAQVKPQRIRSLPIPAAPPEKQKPVERLVERILAAKAQDASADVSALEREIDELVYALYALTPEEIKIVESTAK